MNNAERYRIRELCSLIAVEPDGQTFLELCEELNRILGAEHERPADDKQIDAKND